jgi:ribosome-associated toxin RatA of RatAB toxin-antitoxin module
MSGQKNEENTVRSVQLDLTVPSRSAVDVYATLADFARYPEFSPAVRSVTVTEAGLLRWVEEDKFHPEMRRIDFRQIEGDVAVFDGSWTCTDTVDGTRITFAARLDMGIPSLADALEPIAVRTLVDNTVAIVSGLLGEGVRVDDVQQGTGERDGARLLIAGAY